MNAGGSINNSAFGYRVQKLSQIVEYANYCSQLHAEGDHSSVNIHHPRTSTPRHIFVLTLLKLRTYLIGTTDVGINK